MALQDYYKILEVHRDATPEEIRKSYRRLAVTTHPDKKGGTVEATEKFQLLGEAFDTLKDPNERKQYDEQLQTEELIAPIKKIVDGFNQSLHELYSNAFSCFPTLFARKVNASDVQPDFENTPNHSPN